LKRSSIEKTFEYLMEVLNSNEGAVRVAEIIGRSGSDSSNGPYAQIDMKSFSQVIDLEQFKAKITNIDFSSQPISIQAVFKSVLDGKKYYLRDGRLAERW
jgi:calcineurin-like phosphoesterase